jgi:hypothetical protein
MAPIRNYGDVFALIFFHRKGAKGAEKKYFLFAVERTANKKKTTLCALCVFAVKFKIIHLQRSPIIGNVSVDYTLPYL